MTKWSIVFFVAALGAAQSAWAQITVDQNDDFQSSTLNWAEGGGSPNPPQRISTGGPSGSGDGYLRLVSSGGGGAGSRMVDYNRSQWSGSFIANAITSISLDLNDLGSTPLSIRLGFQGVNGTRFVSSSKFDLSAGSGWVHMTLPIGSGDLTRVSGSGTYANTLADVSEMRIFSSATAQWQGDSLSATLGVDNITAVPEPESYAIAFGATALIAAIFMRHRKGRAAPLCQ